MIKNGWLWMIRYALVVFSGLFFCGGGETLFFRPLSLFLHDYLSHMCSSFIELFMFFF